MSEPASEPAAESADQLTEEQSLLMGLVYGVMHDKDPVGGADFAARVAVCARLSGGDSDVYSKALRKAVTSDAKLTDLFPGGDIHSAIRAYLRAIRHARNNLQTLAWLAAQFEEPQTELSVKRYLVAVERALANNLIGL